MGSVYNSHYEKEIFIVDNIFKKYHPEFKVLTKDPEDEAILDSMAASNWFNIEYIAEQTVAHVGKMEQSAEYGEDFKDNSELKTVGLTKNSKADNGYRLTIKNLHRKKDLIRLIVYNKPKIRLDYFVFRLSEIGFDKFNKTRLSPYYNLAKDQYTIIQDYKVKNFRELCLKK
jgi:hypothetical protein